MHILNQIISIKNISILIISGLNCHNIYAQPVDLKESSLNRDYSQRLMIKQEALSFKQSVQEQIQGNLVIPDLDQTTPINVRMILNKSGEIVSMIIMSPDTDLKRYLSRIILKSGPFPFHDNIDIRGGVSIILNVPNDIDKAEKLHQKIVNEFQKSAKYKIYKAWDVPPNSSGKVGSATAVISRSGNVISVTISAEDEAMKDSIQNAIYHAAPYPIPVKLPENDRVIQISLHAK